MKIIILVMAVAGWAMPAASGAPDAEYTYATVLAVPACVHSDFAESIFSAPTPPARIFGPALKQMDAIRIVSISLAATGPGAEELAALSRVSLFICRDNGDRMMRIASCARIPAAGAIVPDIDRSTYMDDVVAGSRVSLRMEYAPSRPLDGPLTLRCVIRFAAGTGP